MNTETGKVISTGVFRDSSQADSDGAGPAAGVNPAPPKPGQDFITPPYILNNGKWITEISVEPYPDYDPAPFTLKILKGDIATDAPVTTSLPMSNISNASEMKMHVLLN